MHVAFSRQSCEMAMRGRWNKPHSGPGTAERSPDATWPWGGPGSRRVDSPSTARTRRGEVNAQLSPQLSRERGAKLARQLEVVSSPAGSFPPPSSRALRLIGRNGGWVRRGGWRFQRSRARPPSRYSAEFARIGSDDECAFECVTRPLQSRQSTGAKCASKHISTESASCVSDAMQFCQ